MGPPSLSYSRMQALGRLILFSVGLGTALCITMIADAFPSGCTHEISVNDQCCYCFIGTYMDVQLNGTNFCCDCEPGTVNNEATFQRYFSRAETCTKCPIGTFQKDSGKTECNTCPLGRYSGQGATACTSCAPGRFQDDKFKSGCKECPAGFAEESSGSWSCNICPNGFYAKPEATSCRRCPRGYIGDTEGLEDCRICDKGKHAGRQGLTSCSTCSPGNFEDSMGAAWCNRCPGGYYQPNSGETTCIQADKGNYAKRGARSQTPCPMGRYAASPGSPNWRCEGQVQAGRYSQQSGLTSKIAGSLCPAGRYGCAGETDPQCTAACPAGYFCNTRTGEGEYEECGDVSLYCPRGSKAPREVPKRHYASGKTKQTQGHAHLCQLGHYCQNSEIFNCPEGYYGGERGLTVETCSGPCDDGYYCPEGSKSRRQNECAPSDAPNDERTLYYCRNGLRMTCDDGFTSPIHGNTATRPRCHSCPHTHRCFQGRRFSKISWNDRYCRFHNRRHTMYVRDVDVDSSPELIGERLSADVRVANEKLYYWVSSIVENGRTIKGGKCQDDVTAESTISMVTLVDQGNTFGEGNGEIQQYDGRLKINNRSTLRFAQCGRYDVHVGLTVVESNVNESVPGVRAELTEKCNFEMVVEFANSLPQKVDGDIEVPEKMEVFRGTGVMESFGDSLAPKFDDPDGQELMFMLSETDGGGNDVEHDHPFTIGSCSGQMKVRDPTMLIKLDETRVTFILW
eukprot:gb/GECG01015389.1/.p1 GENE.gb/GECG01015389.1/~~gb/GECG01015389.1/.p1  ORF type:complete len:738 (+),score=39.06 gb/GECG01015389.1/:1-2214(+)